MLNSEMITNFRWQEISVIFSESDYDINKSIRSGSYAYNTFAQGRIDPCNG